jgi:sodium transport system permease protein
MNLSNRTRGVAPTPSQAVGFVAMVAVLYFIGGALLLPAFGEAGIAISEWMLLLVPALFFLRSGRFDVRSTLSLRRPPSGALGAATVLVLGAIPLGWLIGWLQSFVIPVPPDLVEGLDQLVTADSPGRFLWLLFLLALTPAICEEVVFRGVLLGGTRALEPWRIVTLNGVVFGLFHVSFETVVRFLPTAYLGVVIAWAVWRTGSLFVGMLMHLLNNALIVVVASVPIARQLIIDPEAPPPLWLVALAVLFFGVGMRLLRLENPPEVMEARCDGTTSGPTEGAT